MKYAVLALEDGSTWIGVGFGAETKVSGEIVFNTGMVGYVQSITDPSFFGQIVCQTYPLIGNYGVGPTELESHKPQIRGYIVSELCRKPSHYRSEKGLDEWLKKHNIPGIEGVDTRELTKTLRVKGTMLGILEVSRDKIDEKKLKDEVASVEDPNTTDLVGHVTVRDRIKYSADSSSRFNVIVIDCGVKLNIIRSLLERGVNVIRVPAIWETKQILSLNPDGILISNGPGDPKKAGYVIRSVKDIIKKRIPMMGICLGNQIMALALGGNTYKLKFGHRGQNHPVIDLDTGKSFITSQNHGFAVRPESLDSSVLRVTFRNGNDGTVEGISHRKLPIMGVQFHPEASPGPQDTSFLFDRFIRMVKEEKA